MRGQNGGGGAEGGMQENRDRQRLAPVEGGGVVGGKKERETLVEWLSGQASMPER